MSFLKRLFGGGAPDDSGDSASIAEAVEHEGYLIKATPQKEGAQYRLCALIAKDVAGETKEHRLIRADLFSSVDEANEAAMRKARQVIKEQGDRCLTDVANPVSCGQWRNCGHVSKTKKRTR